ncbi:hypothetical protein [Dactylosporangium darangshiense]|uniref:hypothetical protein n=1 Tax=Dactylosporangium darangshiense TaxID=579108 RepID=UPI0036277A6C
MPGPAHVGGLLGAAGVEEPDDVAGDEGDGGRLADGVAVRGWGRSVGGGRDRSGQQRGRDERGDGGAQR